MKFKVIFNYSGGSGRAGLANSEFYVLAEAQQAAQQWTELGSPYVAYLWDGESWTHYVPIP